MGAFFLDSSALVKRYVQESGTARMRSLTRRNSGHRLYIAEITAVEITAAVARRRKGGTLTPSKASSILYRFRKHLAGRYTVVEVTPDLLANAARLANKYSLRAYDAVQLAVAVEVDRIHQSAGAGPVTLVSADGELNSAAIAKGLVIDNPNLHP